MFFMKYFLTVFCFLFIAKTTFSQHTDWKNDTTAIDAIFKNALTESSCYNWLEYLCKGVGHRLSGTPAFMAAVEYSSQILDTLGLDSVWLQDFKVPYWERGDLEIVRVVESAQGSFELKCLALGNSVGTGAEGLYGEVVAFNSIDEMLAAGESKVKGKVVFFSRPMESGLIRTFHAYGRAVDQRYNGPHEAAKLGAVAALVRSVTTLIDDHPHTGSTLYEMGGKNIPAFAISTRAAEQLGQLLMAGKVNVFLRSTSKFLEERQSHNVIGEITGTEFPDEIILVGGHLDSWDVGEGAHDDGTGCVQAIEVLHIFKRMGYKPKRTLRCVLFSNEENGLVGGSFYADEAKSKGENHIAALESDSGGFTPRGFYMEGSPATFIPKFKKTGEWLDLLLPYGLDMNAGGSGADIKPLKEHGTLLIGLAPDSQRYFDYHHAETDVFEVVNKRELEMGAAAMAVLVYLIDKYGL